VAKEHGAHQSKQMLLRLLGYILTSERPAHPRQRVEILDFFRTLLHFIREVSEMRKLVASIGAFDLEPKPTQNGTVIGFQECQCGRMGHG
jgi:hypothetical protein